MSMDVFKSMMAAAAGMKAQSARMRIIAQNMANSSSAATKPGEEPYRRQVPTFESELDRKTGVEMIRMKDVVPDKSSFNKKYDPGHPGADENGYVLTSNVNSLIETMDLKEAQRSFEANLNVVQMSRRMLTSVIDILNK